MSLLDTCHTKECPLSIRIISSLLVCADSPYREGEPYYDLFGISSCFHSMPHWGIPPSFQDHLELVGLYRQFSLKGPASL